MGEPLTPTLGGSSVEPVRSIVLGVAAILAMDPLRRPAKLAKSSAPLLNAFSSLGRRMAMRHRTVIALIELSTQPVDCLCDERVSREKRRRPSAGVQVKIEDCFGLTAELGLFDVTNLDKTERAAIDSIPNLSYGISATSANAPVSWSRCVAFGAI